MSTWWLLWMGVMFFFLLSDGYGWGYRGWGPPYPRYIQRRRGLGRWFPVLPRRLIITPGDGAATSSGWSFSSEWSGRPSSAGVGRSGDSAMSTHLEAASRV